MAGEALVVIDLQRDFCRGGALEVADGDAIVPAVNRLAERFEHVVVTQDWHPAGHVSFATSHAGATPFTQVDVSYGAQTLWADHCLQGSAGAELHEGLAIPHVELVLRKGFRKGIDSYSAFLENDHLTPTGLAGYLRERQITRLYLCGLAYDFCVRFSAEDGYRLGFEMVVVRDATRAVGLPGSVEETDAALDKLGIRRVTAAELA